MPDLAQAIGAGTDHRQLFLRGLGLLLLLLLGEEGDGDVGAPRQGEHGQEGEPAGITCHWPLLPSWVTSQRSGSGTWLPTTLQCCLRGPWPRRYWQLRRSGRTAR